MHDSGTLVVTEPMTTPLSRREFIRAGVAAAATGTLGLPLPARAAEPGAAANPRAS